MRLLHILLFAVLAYFALLTEASDGLKIDVKEKPASCPEESIVKEGDRIKVHYRGTLPDGTEFDASYKRGQPFGFQVGKGQVIKGWDQGLMGACIGEKRHLTIPPELGYGARGVPGVIPANSVLHFDVELISIDGRPAAKKGGAKPRKM